MLPIGIRLEELSKEERIVHTVKLQEFTFINNVYWSSGKKEIMLYSYPNLSICINERNPAKKIVEIYGNITHHTHQEFYLPTQWKEFKKYFYKYITFHGVERKSKIASSMMRIHNLENELVLFTKKYMKKTPGVTMNEVNHAYLNILSEFSLKEVERDIYKDKE